MEKTIELQFFIKTFDSIAKIKTKILMEEHFGILN